LKKQKKLSMKLPVSWTNGLKNLVRVALVIPVGSAEAERAFSIMNHARTKRRSHLLPATLNSIMRIRINGVKKIDQFPAQRYANLWVKAGHLRTDDKGGRISANKKPRLHELTMPEEEEKEANGQYATDARLMDGSSLF
jgi:hypothetical protein